MTNKLTTTLLLLLGFAFASYGQIEELEPTIEIETVSEGGDESSFEEDYNDTWKTPFVSDEMTVDAEQNKNWRMGEYNYNAQPKNSWEVGIHFGHFFIDGDVDRKIPGGWGAGLHLRKALNYVFSIRASAFYGQARGIENQPWFHSDFEQNGIGGGLTEQVFVDYSPASGNAGHWFPSHKTTYITGDLAAVLNIGNLLFHKERNKWNWYAAIGLGLDHHTTMLDLYDNNGNAYNNLIEQIGWTPQLINTREGRNQIENDIDAVYDGVFETEGTKKAGIFRVGDDFNIHVVFIPSMGLARKINKRINIAFEHQVILSDNDYLDGIKSRTAFDQTNNVDIGHYTQLRLGINIGNFDKVTEPLYWLNPYDAAFNDIADLKSQPKLDLTDEDNDGVIDIIDQELDSPEDCPVDTRGVILDSDGDGIVDCEDKEPYSRPGCPIDEFGVANCGADNLENKEAINQLIDTRTTEIQEKLISATNSAGGVRQRLETRTITNDDGTTRTETVVVPVAGAAGANGVNGVNGANGAVGATGATGARGADGVSYTNYVTSGCGEWFLPMIHFDLNKAKIKPEYFSHLHNVATVLKKCPEVCVVAQGHTDSRNSNDYNTTLSYKRSRAAVDYLVDNYGIDRSRLKLMFGGEENPMVKAPNSEAHHFMNRRVEFRTCDATDFDMTAPAGYSSGSGGGSGSPNSGGSGSYYNGNKSSGY